MAEEAVNPGSALQGIEYQGNEFASLLKKEFKPKSDDAKSAVEQAVLTLAQQALSQTNLIGSDVDRWRDYIGDPAAKLHLYGKTEARPGRKMGHVTRLIARR